MVHRASLMSLVVLVDVRRGDWRRCHGLCLHAGARRMGRATKFCKALHGTSHLIALLQKDFGFIGEVNVVLDAIITLSRTKTSFLISSRSAHCLTKCR